MGRPLGLRQCLCIVKVASFLADAGHPSRRSPNSELYRKDVLMSSLSLRRQNMKTKTKLPLLRRDSAVGQAGVRTNMIMCSLYCHTKLLQEPHNIFAHGKIVAELAC